MKTSLGMLTVLALTCGHCPAQLHLGPGQSFTHVFDTLPAQDWLADGEFNTGALTLVLQAGTFQTGERLGYEIFEDSTSDQPVFSGVLEGIPPGEPDYDFEARPEFPAWFDLQGALRLTMLEGEAVLLQVSAERLTPISEFASWHYAQHLFPGRNPRLSVVPVGPNSIRLSWPTNFTDCTLEYVADLPADDWQPLPVTPTQENDQFVVTLEAGEARRFYRLHRY